MKEIFKAVKGYEGLYEVSNLGKVKSLRLGKGLILRQANDGRGYLIVGLRKNKILKTFKIHQLVAIAFLNHTPNGHTITVDHVNNNKLDNRLKNLQLITNRENTSKDRFRGNYTSKYVGVSWHKLSKKWQAHIYINDKQKHIGYFLTEIEAHQTYQKYLSQLQRP